MQTNAKLSATHAINCLICTNIFQSEEGMIYLLLLYMHIQVVIQVVRVPVRSLVTCLLIDCMFC